MGQNTISTSYGIDKGLLKNNPFWLTNFWYIYVSNQVEDILCEDFPDYCTNPELFKNKKEKFVKRTEYIEKSLKNLNNTKTKKELDIIIKLLCTYQDLIIKKHNPETILTNLLNWDFSFLIHILESKEKELTTCKNTNYNNELLEEKILIIKEYEQIVEIFFPILSILSHNNQIKNFFWDFINKIADTTEVFLKFIKKNYPCYNNCNKWKLKKLFKLYHIIRTQVLFLWSYFWHNVDYTEIFETSEDQFDIKSIKKEINEYFNKELETINEAIIVFRKKEFDKNDERLKLLEWIEPVLKAKMVLDKFLMYDLIESKFEFSKIWTLSKDDSFQLSKKEEESKLEAINTFVKYYM